MRPDYQAVTFNPPIELLADIEIPDRSGMKTVGDIIRIVIADEEAMNLKNADLKALREYAAKLETIGEKNAK